MLNFIGAVNLANEYGMMYDMYGTGAGFGITGFILNLLIILIVITIVITLLSKTNFVDGDSEQLTHIKKDLEDVKKNIKEIKKKLDKI